MRGPFKEEFYQCVTFGAYTARWQEQLYSTISLLLMYVIPLVTMVTAYLLIFSTIARKSRDFLQEGESFRREKDCCCTQGGESKSVKFTPVAQLEFRGGIDTEGLGTEYRGVESR